MAEEKKKSIGGLWVNESKAGVKYLNGALKINDVDHKIVIFKNTYKKDGDRTPDWNIFLKEEKGNSNDKANASTNWDI